MDAVWKTLENNHYGRNTNFRTEAECLQYFRDVEIKKLNREINEMHEYAKAQSEVLDNWVAKPLITI